MQDLRGTATDFRTVLERLHRATGKYEASFASKLLATFDPMMPVIDFIVLKNLKVRLPYATAKNRLERICDIHAGMIDTYDEYLRGSGGYYLQERFRTTYPDSGITPVKMLDLILWQTRDVT